MMSDAKIKRVLLSRIGLWSVIPVLAFFIVEAFLFKVFQLKVIAGSTLLGSAFVAFMPDLAVGLFGSLCFAVLISRRSRVIALGSVFLFWLCISTVLVVLTASQGYFISTGAHLSMSAISYWWDNAAATNKIVAADAMTWRLPLLIAQPVVVAAFIAAVRLPLVRRRLERKGELSARHSLLIAAVIFFVATGAALIPTLNGAGKSVSRNVFVSIIGQWAAGAGRDDVAESSLADADDTAVVEDTPRPLTAFNFDVEEGAARPNIVFIIFESLNWKSSDVYIKGKNVTPFLKELAKDSLVVENDYTVVPHTSKAIVALQCGMYPFLRTVAKESTPGILPQKCMAHVLRSQGYKTAFFQPADDFEHRSQLVSNMGFESFHGLDDMSHKGFEAVSYFGREDMMMMKPSLNWMEANRDTPFFITYMTLSSHHNYVTPQSFPKVDYPVKDPDQNNYLNAVHYIDSFIGRLMGEMKKRGLDDNTIFFIVGDHGEAFAEHARRQHDLIMWEEGLRALGMIYSPKYFPKPGKITGIRSHMDYLPTVMDILGLTPKGETTQGRSLLSPAIKDRKLLHSCWFNGQCMALREGSIKTIYHFGLQDMEVYDNSKDQFDKHDLAGKKSYDEAFLAARKEQMLAWKNRVNAQYTAWGQALKDGAVLEQEPVLSEKISGNFNDKIEILGVEMSPKVPEAGDMITLKYAFKCLDDLTPSTKMFVHVLSKKGQINADHVPAKGTMPPRSWKPGNYIMDEHEVHIPASWAGQEVSVAIGFWDSRSGARLNVTSKELKIDDKRLFVKIFKVAGDVIDLTMSERELREKISLWVTREVPKFDKKVGVVFGDAIELVGVSLNRIKVKQAGTVEMDYVFKMLKDVPGSWALTVELTGENNEKINGDHIPIGGLYPPVKWSPGEYVTDKHMIHIDMHLVRPGVYRAYLGFKEGKKHVPAQGRGVDDIDEQNRYLLGKVEILPRTEKQ